MKYWLLVLALAGCHDPTAYSIATGPRDWSAHPAIVELAAPADLYAASDVHGGYDRFVALLAANHLIAAVPAAAGSAQWAAGNAVLVVTGDLIDKGPRGLEVVDLLRALEVSAAAQGGTVVVTTGNHEAEFFADPMNSKAEASDGIDQELAAMDIDVSALASGMEPRGLWLRQRPFGARVGSWFFSHAGDTHGRTIAALGAALEAAFDADDFGADELVGADSLLESREWYGDASTVTTATAALGVAHIVFGHDPNALGARGAIATAQSDALIRIDCGMSPDVDDSHGMLLHVHLDASGEVAEQLDPDGAASELWRGQ